MGQQNLHWLLLPKPSDTFVPLNLHPAMHQFAVWSQQPQKVLQHQLRRPSGKMNFKYGQSFVCCVKDSKFLELS